MIFGYDFFLDSNALNPIGNNISISSVEITRGIYDHLTFMNEIYLGDNVFDTTIRNIWRTSTLLNANFNDSVEAGTLADIIGNISRLEVQRKKKGDTNWLTLERIYKDQNSHIKSDFVMYDNFAESGENYLYRVVPYDDEGNEGVSIQADVLSIFNGAYIADNERIYSIIYDYQINNMKRNQVSAVYNPYGAKYPYIVFNAKTNYDSGSVTAILLADTSTQTTKSYLDRKAQKKLVDEFNSWLTNGKPKVLKDYNGLCKLITIHDSVSNNYYKELGNGLASTTFNFSEVGEFTQEYFDKLGITDNFEILSKN